MTTRDIAHAALFAALVGGLGSFPGITLPAVGVPISAQSMGVMLAGAVAGARRGGGALLLFVVLVVLGAPLLASGRAGPGALLGPGGGFIVMWPVAAFVIGALYERSLTSLTVAREAAILFFGGVVLTYALGVPWIAVVAHLSLAQAMAGASLFLPGDGIKVALVVFVARAVRRAYPTLQGRRHGAPDVRIAEN